MIPMDYYKLLTDDQIDVIISHRMATIRMLSFSTVEIWLSDRFGKNHKNTVDFRSKFLLPSKQEEQEAQEIAQEAYNILTKNAF